MAHNINSIAFAGKTPWHGLGTWVPPGSTPDEWVNKSGLIWTAEKAPVKYMQGSALHMVPDRFVLYRSDTGHPFDVVSSRYKPVQPREIVEFYRNITSQYGFEIETVGALGQGEKIWALARTPSEFTLKGGDTVRDYLLLATSYDRSSPTQAFFTSIRVVCANTLRYAQNGEKQAFVTITHRTEFDAIDVQNQLGIHKTAWSEFGDFATALSERKVTRQEAVGVVLNLLKTDADKDVNPEEWSTRKKNIANEIFGAVTTGPGSHLPSADGTAWGLLNGITYYADHLIGARTQSNRLDSAWFGQGAALKQKGAELVAELIQTNNNPVAQSVQRIKNALTMRG